MFRTSFSNESITWLNFVRNRSYMSSWSGSKPELLPVSIRYSLWSVFMQKCQSSFVYFFIFMNIIWMIWLTGTHPVVFTTIIFSFVLKYFFSEGCWGSSGVKMLASESNDWVWFPRTDWGNVTWGAGLLGFMSCQFPQLVSPQGKSQRST